ncbi:MAG: AtpZ/AtpI family protein [Paracoccaceae bacterium]|nr:AtpZ/AtpI family protein [Paracoccaceae bacterium]
MAEPSDKERLEALGKRIKAAKGEERAPSTASRIVEGHSQAQLAWRMVIELVAGIVIGFGIGYGLDSLFGTMPIFLILFILLGFAAGVRTMMRTAQEVQTERAAPAAEDEGK